METPANQKLARNRRDRPAGKTGLSVATRERDVNPPMEGAGRLGPEFACQVLSLKASRNWYQTENGPASTLWQP